MNKLILLLLALVPVGLWAQTPIDISVARTRNLNSTVTVKGIVLNGAEMGVIRYLYDGTAGIAVYDTRLNNVNRGDSLLVTGRLELFNGLLEIVNTTTRTVVNTGNTVPAPKLLDASELDIDYEGQLVQVNDVQFDAAGSVFSGNTEYEFVANGQRGQIYVNNGSPLIGALVPVGTLNIVGPLGQFSGTFQVLPRDRDDLIYPGSIYMISPAEADSIAQDGFVVRWTTNIPGKPFLRYGRTTALELGVISGNDSVANPFAKITGAAASQIYYAQPFSVANGDTAFGSAGCYITQSQSSGWMQVLFNNPSKTSVSQTGVTPIYANQSLDDSLIAWVNRAQESIDFMTYNINNDGLSNMSAAFNAAHDRGVQVRVIFCGSNRNFGIDNLDRDIPLVEVPENSELGIMHNKVVIIDANHSNPNQPMVWTGSTNFTFDQINKDPNHVILIQDQSLALAYTLEFEEMWGGSGPTPGPNRLRGAAKRDNTPHLFNIKGKRVELYFSPSDNTNYHLLRTLATANHELNIITMLCTRTDIARQVQSLAQAGVLIQALVNDTSGAASNFWRIVEPEPNATVGLYPPSSILHHKYAVGDFLHPNSDPFVWTGSHNWTNAANNRNDENSIVIYCDTIADLFYQESEQRLEDQRNWTSTPAAVTQRSDLRVFPNPTTGPMQVVNETGRAWHAMLMDTSGRTLAEYVLHPGQHTLNLSAELPAGLYLLVSPEANAFWPIQLQR
jgi:phosphatidylserine/phosphatidylglycerophosphate/cardiolipin synthase-like enzyme